MSDAARIARIVTRDLDLNPPLSALDVEVITDPNADSFLPPLHKYDENWRAAIESRILQEVDR
jgi:hypothetical protein